MLLNADSAMRFDWIINSMGDLKINPQKTVMQGMTESKAMFSSLRGSVLLCFTVVQTHGFVFGTLK
jgi:hypothetical protein